MSKKKILFVIDKPNWAYDQMANYVIKELAGEYEFYKLIAHYHLNKDRQTLNYRVKQPFRYFKAMMYENYKSRTEYDLIVYMWWYLPRMTDLSKLKITSRYEVRGIFTESFPPGKTVDFDGSVQGFVDEYIKPATGLVAGNRNIKRFYEQHGVPVYYATGATDSRLFRYNRIKRADQKLRVCWTGNPHRNFKGFFDFVEPAVKLAQSQRPGIELVTRFSGPLKTLPEFYSGVDIMVNASVGDAGPGFIVDAGACGVPVITTDGGFASEIIEDRVNGLFVERDIKKISEKIIEVYDDRELLDRMSKKISNDIVGNWGHAPRAEFWARMFAEILEGDSNETV